jgi:hypothetical protein
MVLLGDIGQVEARFGPFGDSINLDERQVHGLSQMYNGHGNLFRHTRWYFLVTLVKWKLASDHLEIVLISMQDRCTVCAECTICFEIALGTPDGNPGWLDQAKDHISFFGDSVNLDARYVHGLRRAYHRFRNHFGCNRWYSYVAWAKWKLILQHLEIESRCKISAWFAPNVL